jgi:SsrA-binding protein
MPTLKTESLGDFRYGNQFPNGPMSKKEKSGKKKDDPASKNRPVAENRKARQRFEVLETLECGIALAGSEVKSLRQGKLSLDEAYGRVRNGEVWLVGADIPEYTQANLWNHQPRRPRKLLVHKSEVRKFANKAHEKGLTLVPLKVYFNERGLAKLLLGLCRGRKLHDKREVLKKRDMQREMERAVRRR